MAHEFYSETLNFHRYYIVAILPAVLGHRGRSLDITLILGCHFFLLQCRCTLHFENKEQKK